MMFQLFKLIKVLYDKFVDCLRKKNCRLTTNIVMIFILYIFIQVKSVDNQIDA